MAFSIQPNEINGIPQVRKFLKELLENGGGSGGGSVDPETLEKINKILSCIPTQASEDNKLTDTNFVNSSIATSTATFRGTSEAGLTEQQFLAWANSLTKDNNDYIFWNTIDSDGNIIFKKYKYNGTAWSLEYSLNNSSFTAAQWASIQSGITSELVAKLIALYTKTELDAAFIKSTAIRNVVVISQADYENLSTKDANTEYNII